MPASDVRVLVCPDAEAARFLRDIRGCSQACRRTRFFAKFEGGMPVEIVGLMVEWASSGQILGKVGKPEFSWSGRRRRSMSACGKRARPWTPPRVVFPISRQFAYDSGPGPPGDTQQKITPPLLGHSCYAQLCNAGTKEAKRSSKRVLRPSMLRLHATRFGPEVYRQTRSHCCFAARPIECFPPSVWRQRRADQSAQQVSLGFLPV